MMEAPKKPPIRFNVAVDLSLLKETVATNPYRESLKWSDVVQNLHMEGLTERRARERIALLLQHYKAEDNQNLKRSGTEEEFTETQALCQELVDLGREVANKPSKVDTEQVINRQKGLDIRKWSLEGLSSSEDRPAKKKRDVMWFLESKLENDKQQRKDELRLREQELELRRQQLEIDRKKAETESRQVELQYQLFQKLLDR